MFLFFFFGALRERWLIWFGFVFSDSVSREGIEFLCWGAVGELEMLRRIKKVNL
jgi:hypothetical protein